MSCLCELNLMEVKMNTHYDTNRVTPREDFWQTGIENRLKRIEGYPLTPPTPRNLHSADDTIFRNALNKMGAMHRALTAADSDVEILTDEDAGFSLEGITGVFLDGATASVAAEYFDLGYSGVDTGNVGSVVRSLTSLDGATLFSRMTQIKGMNGNVILYTMDTNSIEGARQMGYHPPEENNIGYGIVDGFSGIGERTKYTASFSLDQSDLGETEQVLIPEELRVIIRKGGMDRKFAEAIFNVLSGRRK